MSLEVVLGPMFAGKSSYILSYIRRYESIGWPVLCITSSLDTRYEEGAIHSHNHERHSAVSTATLLPIQKTDAYKEAKLIVIEEGQFFPDLLVFTQEALDTDKKDLLVVGLDGDAERRPFGQLLQIIPLCDKVMKLTAMCKPCSKQAIFTHRRSADTSVIKVGGQDEYEALCRACYIKQIRAASFADDCDK